MVEFLKQLFEQTGRAWQKFTPTQRITVLSVGLGSLLALVMLVMWSGSPDYVMLASGLSSDEMLKLQNALDTSGINYKVRGSDSVLVPQKQKDKAARALTSAGVSMTGSFDEFSVLSQARLGMTSEQYKQLQIRLKERRLAEQIEDNLGADAVDVNLVIPEKRLFEADKTVPTASVAIRIGRGLSKGEVGGVRQLIAFAVDGLSP